VCPGRGSSRAAPFWFCARVWTMTVLAAGVQGRPGSGRSISLDACVW
jgi:hypothetical protein